MFVSKCLYVNNKGHLTIGGCDTLELAKEFGTPLYVLDETTIRNVCKAYVKSFEKYYHGNGMRVTDKETIDIVQMVLAGKVNKSLVQLLGSHGGKAMGLCGLDGRMLMAEKLVTGADLGYVGEIKEVNPEPLNNALASGYIPIVSTVAGGYDGNVYNINADIAASQIAAKIGAKKLILMTDIRGLLRDVHDEDSLIPVVNVSEVPMLKRDGIISGGMIPKIDCCVEAVRSGVNRAHIIDGRIEHSILLELFSDEGIGTMFY